VVKCAWESTVDGYKLRDKIMKVPYWQSALIERTSFQVADYIPQLAKQDPSHFGIALCTIDGQRFSLGSSTMPFTLQSCCKPLNYAIALNELGADVVHGYIGQEPSGRKFNDLDLDYNSRS